MKNKPTLQQWLEMIDAHLDIDGALYHPTNPHINVEIKQNDTPYGVLGRSCGGGGFGRSEGDAAKVPNIYEAVMDLLSIFVGNRVTFGGDHVLVVPQLDATVLAEKL